MNQYKHLFEYDRQANLKLLDPASANEANGPVVEILAHMSKALRIWYNRITRQDQGNKIWPNLELGNTRKEFENVYKDLSSFLLNLDARDLDGDASYINSKNQHFTSSLEDILDHLLLHSAYHRGQVNLLSGRRILNRFPLTIYFIKERNRMNTISGMNIAGSIGAFNEGFKKYSLKRQTLIHSLYCNLHPFLQKTPKLC